MGEIESTDRANQRSGMASEEADVSEEAEAPVTPA